MTQRDRPARSRLTAIAMMTNRRNVEARFRRARPGDEQLLLGIVERSLAPYGLRVDPTGIDRVLTELAERFPELPEHDGHDPAQMWVLEVIEPPGAAPVVAGCGGFQPWEGTRGGDAPLTCELFKMYLEPGWKGCGLGRRLLDWLEERAAGAGYERVWLETHSVLREADAMYRRHGYAPTDEGHVCSRCSHQLMKVLARQGSGDCEAE